MNINSPYNSDTNSSKQGTTNQFQANENQTNDFFRNIFHNSKAITLIINPQCGTIIEANQAASHFYQYSIEELIGMSIKEINILSSDEINKEMQLAKRELRNYFNFQHKLKNGEIKHVEVFSNPIQIGSNVYLHSIVNESQEKAKLKNESIKFKEIANQSPVTIVMTNLEGEITYVNPKFTELTGYTAKQAIGKNPRILKSGKTPPLVYKELWKRISSGQDWTGEFINKRANGELFWEKAYMSPLFEDSKIVGYLAIKEDITEQKENKEKLNKLNSQLRQNLNELHAAYEEVNTINETLKDEREQFLSLLNSIPEVIYVTQKDTNIILFANKKANEIVGRNILGERCYKAIQNRDSVCTSCKKEEVIQKKKTCYSEQYNSTLNKHFYIIDRHITWINGEDAHFQMSIDITATKEIEIELRKTQHELQIHRDQLIESNATKDKFFSIISHDLKNPFNSIMGLTGLLKEKIERYDKETIAQYAGHIYDASRNSYKLLQNLLEWSRSQMGRISYSPSFYNLATIIDEATTSNLNQAQSKNITVDIDCPDSVQVYADNNMLSTIVRNLISNAIKFSPKGEVIKIEATENKNYTQIKIIDNGKGMEKSILDKLFKISEKVTTPGTEDEKGTGLGLLLCKEFIDQHNGEIIVESEVRKGSTFTVNLPHQKAN
jgi:PAS domain S-box-containing protein